MWSVEFECCFLSQSTFRIKTPTHRNSNPGLSCIKKCCFSSLVKVPLKIKIPILAALAKKKSGYTAWFRSKGLTRLSSFRRPTVFNKPNNGNRPFSLKMSMLGLFTSSSRSKTAKIIKRPLTFSAPHLSPTALNTQIHAFLYYLILERRPFKPSGSFWAPSNICH